MTGSITDTGTATKQPLYRSPDPDAERRSAWMHEGKLGLTTHYFPTDRADVEDFTRRFDVERVAEQCEQAGAKWFMLTLHHQAWLMQAPNAELDRITGRGDFTAERDLPLELHAALAKRGVRMMLYVNLRIDPEGGCQPEIQEALGPWPPEDRTMRQVADVWRVFAERYGEKVSGWWVDGVWTKWFKQAAREDRERWFAILAEGLRAGNTDAAVAMNPGVKDVFDRYSAQNDFLAGEANELLEPPAGRFLDGAQWHVWPYLGPWWGSGGCRFETAELCDWAKRVVASGGTISFEVGTRGITKADRSDKQGVSDGPVGAIDPRQVAQVRAVAEAIGGV